MKYLAGASAVILILAAHAWLLWGEVRFGSDLFALAVDLKGRPVHRGRSDACFGANGFVDGIPSESIARSWKLACLRLEALRGGNPRRTYSWQDQMGYPRATSVVQLPGGYVAVTAYQGNDSDGIRVIVAPGVSSARDQSGVRVLSSDDLPPGTLRCR